MPARARGGDGGEKPAPKKPQGKTPAKGKNVAKRPKKEPSDSGVSDEGNEDHSHPVRGGVPARAHEDLLLTSTN